MIKLFSRIHMTRTRILRSYCRILVAALTVAAALSINQVSAQAQATQTVDAPTTVSNSGGSLTVTYGASFDPAPPAVSSEDTLKDEAWSWSSNCTPQSGSGSVSVSFTAPLPGNYNSGVSCTVSWDAVNNITGKVDGTVTVSGSATTICIINSGGYTVTVSAGVSPTTIGPGQSALGQATASIAGTDQASDAEISANNPHASFSIAGVKGSSGAETVPSAKINGDGTGLTVSTPTGYWPDTYIVTILAAFAWTDSNGKGFSASGTATVSVTIPPDVMIITSSPTDATVDYYTETSVSFTVAITCNGQAATDVTSQTYAVSTSEIMDVTSAPGTVTYSTDGNTATTGVGGSAAPALSATVLVTDDGTVTCTGSATTLSGQPLSGGASSNIESAMTCTGS